MASFGRFWRAVTGWLRRPLGDGGAPWVEPSNEITRLVLSGYDIRLDVPADPRLGASPARGAASVPGATGTALPTGTPSAASAPEAPKTGAADGHTQAA
jgi:hypothetical protein